MIDPTALTVNCTTECPTEPHFHIHPITLDDELRALTTPQPRKATVMKLSTEDMHPRDIEIHDLARDIEAVTEAHEASGYGPEFHAKHDELAAIVLNAVTAGNPNACALAALVLNMGNTPHDRWYE